MKASRAILSLVAMPTGRLGRSIELSFVDSYVENSGINSWFTLRQYSDLSLRFFAYPLGEGG